MAEYSDNFNGADQDPLEAPWVNGAASGAGAWALVRVGNRLTRGDGSFEEPIAYYNQLLAADHSVEFDHFDGAGNPIQIIGRLTNPGASATGYGIEVFRSGTARLYRMSAGWGTKTELNNASPGSLADGTRWKLQCLGDQITAEYKEPAGAWTPTLSATDATYSAGGYAAVGSLVFCEADNFLATELGGGPTTGVVGDPDYSMFPKHKLRTAA